MRLGVKFSLTNIVIVVSLSILLELASFLVFSKAIHSLEKKLFNEQVERLLLLAFEQDELIFEGLYNDEKNAQMRVVDKFRIIYRKQKNNVTFPFIIDTNGKVIAHPESEKDIQMFDKDSLTFMNNQKEGELEYSYNGIRKWCVFKTFKPWNWIFCMTTSMYKKNEAIIPFISTALIISLVFIVLSIFAVLFVSHKYISPIYLVIQRIQAIAKREKVSTLERDINPGASKDEIRMLSQAVSTLAEDLEKTTVSRDKLAKEIKEHKKVQEELSKSQIATLNIMEDLQEAYNRLKNTQEQLIQAEKLSAVGVLASGVAHEVKNPLGIIIQAANYLEGVISGEQKDIRELNNVVKMIKDSVLRADGIIRGLLDFTRFSALDLHPEDINAILSRSLELVKHRKEFAGVEVIEEKQDNLPKALVDKDKLQQVFINFITNALLAMVDSDNKKLIIRSYITRLNEIQPKVGRRVSDNFRLGERVIRADIEDTGRGISEANMKKIFDPFFSTRGPREGAGLGLAICLNIIDLHKGFIEVESQEGKGSKFTITLKIKEDSQNG